MGVSKDEREKEKGSGTTAEDIEVSEGALWGKRTTFKRSNDEHGRVDNEMGSGDSCRI